MDVKNLGKTIAEQRKRLNMSQKNLADKLNVSNKTISKWECGNGIPDIESLDKLASAFGITLEELLNPKPETAQNEKEETQAKSTPTHAVKKISRKLLLGLLISCGSVLIAGALLCYFLVPRTPRIESAEKFLIDEQKATLTCTVDYSVEEFSFGAIEVPRTNEWSVYYDEGGRQGVSSPTVALEEGDNVFYMIIENNAGENKVYQVVIRRKPMYTVTFNTNGGENIASQEVMEGELATCQDPVKVGYVFNGWDFDFMQPITQDITVNASWIAKSFTIVYYANDGTEDSISQDVVYDSPVTFKNATAFGREGYTLSGWNTKTDGTGTQYALEESFEAFGLCESDLYLYAQWTVNQYTLTASQNLAEAGTISGMGTFDYGTAQTLTAVSNEGYTWLGWYSKEDVLVTSELTLTVTIGTEGQEYLAKWEVKKYTITMDVSGGEPLLESTQTVTYGSDYTLTVPQKAGYEFWGWYTGEDGTGTKITTYYGGAISDWAFDEDITVYAKWDAVSYFIKYNLDGGTGALNPLTYTIENQNITLQNPTRDGYTFTGWMGTGLTEATLNVVIPTGSYGERTYTATWSANENTLHFDGNGATGGTMTDIRAYSDEVITLPKNEFTRDGYVFMGWAKTAFGEMQYTDGAEYTMDVSNTTLFAVWQEIEEITDEQGIVYTPSSDKSYYIVKNYNNSVESVEIADNHYGIPVKEIASNAFEDSDMQTVTIPDGITYIGYRAFANCNNLKEVTIPDSVEYVMDQAFFGCDNLEKAIVSSDINYFAVHVFEICNNVTIYCDATEKPVGWVLNWNCNRPVVWAEGEPIRYEYTLEGDKAVLTKYLGNDTVVEIPSNIDGYEVVGISTDVFKNNKNIRVAVIPDSAKEIGDYAFYGCESLESIKLGKGVESIGAYSFSGCAIKTMDIPMGVTHLGVYLFDGNTEEITVYCEASEMPDGWDASWSEGCVCEVKWGGLLQVVYDAFIAMNVPYTFTDGILFSEPTGVETSVKYKASTAMDYSSVTAKEGGYSIPTQADVARYEIVIIINGIERTYTVVRGTIWTDFDAPVTQREYVLATTYMRTGAPEGYENDGLLAYVDGYTGGFLTPNLNAMWLYVHYKNTSFKNRFTDVAGKTPTKMGAWIYSPTAFTFGADEIWGPGFGYATASIEIKAGYHFYELPLPGNWWNAEPIIGFHASTANQYYIDALVLL